eukprot:TRINITY_DN13012_c0_g1_i1.p1 TRINITY_DN13012_c0_g1~~TRINITY_DN13012_c0_g1_i1.p1  ORF type:complete len:217 (-),score=26.84 TRINITY_DN13012_c0_g1_i1:93-743(-)
MTYHRTGYTSPTTPPPAGPHSGIIARVPIFPLMRGRPFSSLRAFLEAEASKWAFTRIVTSYEGGIARVMYEASGTARWNTDHDVANGSRRVGVEGDGEGVLGGGGGGRGGRMTFQRSKKAMDEEEEVTLPPADGVCLFYHEEGVLVEMNHHHQQHQQLQLPGWGSSTRTPIKFYKSHLYQLAHHDPWSASLRFPDDDPLSTSADTTTYSISHFHDV